ncbi:MAG: CDP-diacylglycerol O-phosphatidyltransferase [Deltaproteobacteria bacterium]|nr:CDP-diacylglycerol O-phosphatidyltransferase [Deltaproteobacteria bacterium]
MHLFTACGAVVGAGALVAIANGAWTPALLLMLAGLFIDAVDGMLARSADVDRQAPRIDGRRLDDIVDYVNYVIVPVVFMVATGLLPHWAWAAAPVLASAYGFSQVAAKTDDDFFLGFPSYWNVLAIYLFLLQASPSTSALLVAVLSVGVFVPWKYIYPSKLRSHRAFTFTLAIFCFAAVSWSVLDPQRSRSLHLVELSLVFPAWYLWLSWHLGGLMRTTAK